MSNLNIAQTGKTCKRGHKMKLVGRGDKKRWICNACRRQASRGKGGRRMAASVLWSPGNIIPFDGAPVPYDSEADDYGLEAPL